MNEQGDNLRQKILAVHPGALGDVIIFSRLLERTGGDVTLVAGKEKADLLRGLGVVERAMDFETLPMHECFSDTPLKECRLPCMLGGHDRLISCFCEESGEASVRLAGMCGAESAAFLPIRPSEDFRGHLLDLWCDMLGMEVSGKTPAARAVPREWREQADNALKSSGVDANRPYVVLHVGAGSEEKCLPRELIASLAGNIGTRQMLITLGPVELDRWDAGKLDTIRREFATLSCPPLPILAGVLAGAAAFVGGDCGPAHLAGCVGTPTLTLFGPSREEHFAPIGPRVRTIAGRTLGDIPPGCVVTALRKLIEARTIPT